MKFIDEISLPGKKVLMRVDFNVPLDEHGEVADDNRIRAALPSIRHILSQGGRLILCSHLGRPGGRPAAEFSLQPAARKLAELLEAEVPLAPDCQGPEVAAMVNKLKDGGLLLLENLRFHAEETRNEPAFAKAMASMAEAYVNDAFAVSHRRHASIVSLPRLLPERAAGFLIQREIQYFKQAIDSPARPLTGIIGGAKVSSKLQVLENLLGQVDRLIIGGAMANTFLKAKGLNMGASMIEEDLLETARSLLDRAERQGIKIYLPVDSVTARELSEDSPTKTQAVEDISGDWMALDIGPESSRYFSEALGDAETIIWNGPMGAFEFEPFSHGTFSTAKAVGRGTALSIIGGGDTGLAVQRAGEADNISYISTGGGAFLHFLSGRELPGLSAL
ncbi:MAG TPA: phosphoglycerate kinase, partial [Desulfobacterales bacterium]|nr:phosphoglycerate kinase [Desulfobacterales bacterium]